jgi:hypothetical protein
MNKAVLIAILILVSTVLSSQFVINAGLNTGGAIPTEKTEGSSAILLPGGYFSAGTNLMVTRRLRVQPSAYLDFKLFKYSAVQQKDTVVQTEVAGILANVPTYYSANVNGFVNLGSIGIEIPIAFALNKKSSIVFGPYANMAIYKYDQIDLNVQIGEGGLIPDYDTSYNNKGKINTFEAGVMLGGRFKISDQVSLSFTGYRALSRFYVKDAVLDDAGRDIPFYYTSFRVGITYLIKPEPLFIITTPAF